jgi:hypothetical protein
MTDSAWFRITLREWAESQRQEQTPHRAALLTAIESSDLPRLRELLAEAPFDQGQRRYLDDLINRWEQSISGDE